jgi:hypothetical protein
MTLKTDILETPSGGPVALTGQSAAKAWSVLDASTASEAASFNISGYVDNGVGDFSFTVSSDMSSSSFQTLTTANESTAIVRHIYHAKMDARAAGSVDVEIVEDQTGTGVGAYYDADDVNLTIFGDLA